MSQVTELVAPTVALASVHKVVGARVTRPDAAAKVLGQAVYAGDIRLPGMAHGKVVRSPHARARVTGVDVSRALSMPGVLAALTAADVPGQNGVGTLQVKDQPVLAPGLVNFAGEAVALVVAETEELAAAAAALVRVEYEPLPPVIDPAEALTDAAPRIHQGGNLCRELRIVRGDFEAAAARAALVVTNTYRTRWTDHGYIEPDVVVGKPDGEGVILHVSTKSPHSDQAEVARVLGVARERVRIVAATVGGSFGGKPDIPLLCLAAMAVRRVRRPVRLAMTRQECLLAKLKRHPFTITATHAVAADGSLLGVRVEALADAGAYALSSPHVIAKAMVHAAGPYRVGAVDLHGRVAYTNNPVTSAVRGYGVPQVVFAAERQMDVIAQRLGMDAVELRRRNALRRGDMTATGHVLAEARLVEALDAVERRALELGCPPTGSPRERRAWGVAACYYGCGRMGTPDHARVRLKLEPDGTVRLFVGAPEIGQGSDTALAQIAAEELGLPFGLLRVTSADTGLCYDAGVSSASRVTYVVGSAVFNGARELKGRLLAAMVRQAGGSSDHLPPNQASLADLARFCAERGFAVDADGEFHADSGPLDDEGQGRPFGAYTFGAQMSRVRVDLETGAVVVEETVGCFDAGTVVNPVQFEGQMQGGAAMAQGLALTEEIVVRDGVPLNTSLHTYLLPTAADVPGLEAMSVEASEPTGPFGAKGVGEPAILPGAAAVANAVAAALGAEVWELPLTPERVMRAIRRGATSPSGSPWPTRPANPRQGQAALAGSPAGRGSEPDAPSVRAARSAVRSRGRAGESA